jgi:hypothetical protein
LKFILFVEGYTERDALPSFFKRWLDRKLEEKAGRPVGIKVVRFEGWSEFRKDVKRKALLYLNGPQSADIIAVIGLLDLYGPNFYPGHLIETADRFKWAKQDIEDDVAHPRFRQFFSVHEVEAWLLSEPALFPPQVRTALPGRIAQPEAVNFAEPPSKLLQKLYQERAKQTYKKITHGKDLFDRLDPFIAYDRCPYLKELLDEMLKLAS